MIKDTLAKMVGRRVEVHALGLRPESDPTVDLYVPLQGLGFALWTRKSPKRDTIDRAVTKLHQGWLLTHIFRVTLPVGRTVAVRTKVCLDSFIQQSYAKFEVFEDLQWRLVHSLDGYQLDHKGFNYTADPNEQLLEALAAPMVRVGMNILGVDE